ncbi:MAG: geranylgeranylglyceryl/heptaprenylglyceryl phosphate synthase [Bacteroidota bacterium]|nr:geranylgeranylglyceryl/heptaprenylglyceryl phosphate synthase [Bacteroidota bacterium]
MKKEKYLYFLILMNSVEKNIVNSIKKGKKLFAWLIDPDKVSPETFEKKLIKAKKFNIDLIFLGGSLLVEDKITEYIKTIKKYFSIPVILFPGSTNQVNKNADAILFLSLISGRNPDFLIGRHVEVASIIKKTSLAVLPTGYILVESGRQTTASYISNTFPVPHHKADIAVSTAIAGELLGLKYIFLDGGSGALKSIDTQMISAVKKNINIPLIVGGGIKESEQLKNAYNAGADIVVVGNIIEDNFDKLQEFTKIKASFGG